jgi:hypothetical protein
MLNLRRAVVRVTRARRLRFLPELGGPAIFSPLPLRRAMAALSAMLLIGCSSYAAKTAATIGTRELERDFYAARYAEACHVTMPPAWCYGTDVALDAYARHLNEALLAAELVRKTNARMPLQLELLDADSKGLRERVKP